MKLFGFGIGGDKSKSSPTTTGNSVDVLFESKSDSEDDSDSSYSYASSETTESSSDDDVRDQCFYDKLFASILQRIRDCDPTLTEIDLDGEFIAHYSNDFNKRKKPIFKLEYAMSINDYDLKLILEAFIESNNRVCQSFSFRCDLFVFANVLSDDSFDTMTKLLDFATQVTCLTLMGIHILCFLIFVERERFFILIGVCVQIYVIKKKCLCWSIILQQIQL
jgi:hypothetical protein